MVLTRKIDTYHERSIDQDLLDGSKINFFFPRKLEDSYNPKLLISCIPDIIKNYRGAKQLHFTFLGYGSQMNDCVRLVKNLQIEDNCSFIRYLPENSFINVLKSSDAIICCNKTDGSSISILKQCTKDNSNYIY